MMWLAALLLLAAPAYADSGMLLGGVANRRMPFDGFTVTRACSPRRLLTSYTANKAYNIVRASDSTTTDIGFTAAGLPDIATPAAFCAATTCKLNTCYDQSPTADDYVQATDANRFTFQQSAILSTWPAFQATGVAQIHETVSDVTPATGSGSFFTIANRSVGVGACNWVRGNGAANRIQGQGSTTNAWLIVGGTSGTRAVTANDAAWHTGAGIINSGVASTSLIAADGVDSAVQTITGNTTAGKAGFGGVASTTCNIFESVYLDNTVLTAGQRLYLSNGARVALGNF